MEITPIWANRCLATRNTLGHRDPVFASTSAFTGVHRGRSSPLGARCRRGRCTWPQPLKRAWAQNSGMILATVGALFVFWLTLMVGLALMALMAP
jgi:hypothetical protein